MTSFMSNAENPSRVVIPKANLPIEDITNEILRQYDMIFWSKYDVKRTELTDYDLLNIRSIRLETGQERVEYDPLIFSEPGDYISRLYVRGYGDAFVDMGDHVCTFDVWQVVRFIERL